MDIEDAQAATEAVVQSQLERGRFDEAVLSARQARVQSIRFHQKVSAILSDTRRDVDRVDWQEEAPRLLDDALEHIKRRMAVERGILDRAETGLSELVETGTAGGRALAEVAELTRDCYRRHAELHGQLIGARNVFLEAQAAQSFSRQPSALARAPRRGPHAAPRPPPGGGSACGRGRFPAAGRAAGAAGA